MTLGGGGKKEPEPFKDARRREDPEFSLEAGSKKGTRPITP